MSDTDTTDDVTAGAEGSAEDTTTTTTTAATDTDASTWTPPTEAEWKATQAKLKKANGEAAAHRKQADELRRKGETETEAAARTAREEAEKAATTTWKPRLVRMAARTALVEAGLIGKPDRLLRLIDAEQVEIDEDGEVSGIDEQIADLKKEYPDLFGKRGAARIDGADRGDSGAGSSGGMSRATKLLLQQAGR